MTQHTELIERLNASSRWWFDRGVKNSVDADAIAALEAQAREIEGLRKDAACFRFWVREAAVNPCDMAKLIMRCTTEQEYRDAIEPLATAAEDAIRAAMKGQP
jgi:hypothetical protein